MQMILVFPTIKKDRLLIAYAEQPLQIKNTDLGYTLTYFMRT